MNVVMDILFPGKMLESDMMTLRNNAVNAFLIAVSILN